MYVIFISGSFSQFIFVYTLHLLLLHWHIIKFDKYSSNHSDYFIPFKGYPEIELYIKIVDALWVHFSRVTGCQYHLTVVQVLSKY